MTTACGSQPALASSHVECALRMVAKMLGSCVACQKYRIENDSRLFNIHIYRFNGHQNDHTVKHGLIIHQSQCNRTDFTRHDGNKNVITVSNCGTMSKITSEYANMVRDSPMQDQQADNERNETTQRSRTDELVVL